MHDLAVVVKQAGQYGFVCGINHPHRAPGGQQPAFLRVGLGGRAAPTAGQRINQCTDVVGRVQAQCGAAAQEQWR